MMHQFLVAFFGGALLGYAVVGYLYINGRIAGISGLLSQFIQPKFLFKSSAFWFVLGLFTIPFIYSLFQKPEISLDASPVLMIIAGLLVGFGTRLGSGCTSGHGICGISRLSKRSIFSTLTFMLVAIITVYIMRHVVGSQA